MAKRYHVTRDKKAGDWKVKAEGADRAAARADTKKEAVQEGRQIAGNQKGQLIIHRRDGQIQEERTYGKDPFPPKG